MLSPSGSVVEEVKAKVLLTSAVDGPEGEEGTKGNLFFVQLSRINRINERKIVFIKFFMNTSS